MKYMGSYNDYGKSDNRDRSLSYELLNGYNEASMPSMSKDLNTIASGYASLQDKQGLTKSSQVPSGGLGMKDYGKLLGGAGGDWADPAQFGQFTKMPTIQNTYDIGSPAEMVGRRQVQQYLLQQMSQLQPTMKYPSFGGR